MSLVAQEISAFLTEGVDYTDNVLAFMGHQIRIHNNPEDYEYILGLFKGFYANSKLPQTLSWTLLSWVDSQDRLMVDTKLGVLSKENVKIVSGQPHIEAVKKIRWKVKLAKPQHGNTSGKWIIPAALGITNNEGDYIGSLIFGFEIEKLKEQFEAYTNQEQIRFILADYEQNIIMSSSEDFVPDRNVLFQISQQSKRGSSLSYVNSITGTNYYAYKLNKYPYIVYLSYKPEVIYQSIWTSFRQNMIEIVTATALLSLIIWFLYRRIIKPVAQLSSAANALSRDAENINIPRTNSYEMFTLAKALIRTKSYKLRDKRAKLLLQENNQSLKQKNETLNRYSQDLKETNDQLKLTKDKLEQALQIVNDSDREREAFLRDMHRSLHVPISAIINGVVLLKQEKLGTLNKENYGMIFDAIYDAGKQLESLTTEFLNPTQVDVTEVLQKCVIIQRRYATEKNVSIHLSLSKKLPVIWADRLRLRQVLLSTIYHSLLFIPDNEKKKIFVTTRLKKNAQNKPNWLEIEIKDNGGGVDEKSRQLFWQKHFKGSNSYNRDPNMMNLDVKALRHLVALHHGTFSIEVLPNNKGTVFTIRIPYLSREEIEVPIELQEKHDQEAYEYQHRISQAIEKAENILKFPPKKKD